MNDLKGMKTSARREQEDSFAEVENAEAAAAAEERLRSGRKAAAKARSGHQLPAAVPMGRAHHILAAGATSCLSPPPARSVHPVYRPPPVLHFVWT